MSPVNGLSQSRKANYTNPKMTAFQTMMLFSDGAPLTPAGGSSWRLKNKLPKEVTFIYYTNITTAPHTAQVTSKIHYRRGVVSLINVFFAGKVAMLNPESSRCP